MRKFVCIAVNMLFLFQVHAQSDVNSMFLEDITGKPFIKLNTEGIEGTPFLSDTWTPGTVIFMNGTSTRIESLRFSPYNNTLYFLRGGQTYEFAEPVRQFEISHSEKGKLVNLLFRSGYPPIDKLSSETFYQVLKDDSIQLLRLLQKTIEEYKPYNQPVVKRFADREYYYVFRDGNISRTKKKSMQ